MDWLSEGSGREAGSTAKAARSEQLKKEATSARQLPGEMEVQELST